MLTAVGGGVEALLAGSRIPEIAGLASIDFDVWNEAARTNQKQTIDYLTEFLDSPFEESISRYDTWATVIKCAGTLKYGYNGDNWTNIEQAVAELRDSVITGDLLSSPIFNKIDYIQNLKLGVYALLSAISGNEYTAGPQNKGYFFHDSQDSAFKMPETVEALPQDIEVLVKRLLRDPNITYVFYPEKWDLPQIDYGGCWDGEKADVQTSQVRNLIDFLKKPYIVDKFSRHEDRRKWRGELEPDIRYFYEHNNALKYHCISSTLINIGLITVGYLGHNLEKLKSAATSLRSEVLGQREYGLNSTEEKIEYIKILKSKVYGILIELSRAMPRAVQTPAQDYCQIPLAA